MGGEVRPCTVRGPLAPWAAGFEDWLVARGFSRWTVRQRLCLFAVLSGWLEREGLGAGELTEARAGLFVAARRRAGLRSWVSPRCVALPLVYLREVGAVPPPVPVVADGPVEVLLEGYREYLLVERGLARSTVVRYECLARVFLEQRPVGLELERLTAADVSAFLARECPRRSVGGARKLVESLRPLLRYLHVAGLIERAAGVGGARRRGSAGPVVAARVGARGGRQAVGELRQAADGRAAGLRDLVAAGPARVARRGGRCDRA